MPDRDDRVWHDVGHRLPPDDTPAATPTDLYMAAEVEHSKRLERLDRAEEQREQRRQR